MERERETETERQRERERDRVVSLCPTNQLSIKDNETLRGSVSARKTDRDTKLTSLSCYLRLQVNNQADAVPAPETSSLLCLDKCLRGMGDREGASHCALSSDALRSSSHRTLLFISESRVNCPERERERERERDCEQWGVLLLNDRPLIIYVLFLNAMHIKPGKTF